MAIFYFLTRFELGTALDQPFDHRLNADPGVSQTPPAQILASTPVADAVMAIAPEQSTPRAFAPSTGVLSRRYARQARRAARAI